MDEFFIPSIASELAYAIAVAEGFFVADSVPARSFNPGDMELGDRGWGVLQGKTIYVKADWNASLDDRTDGCSALRRECIAILSGASLENPVNATFEAFAFKWTGNDAPGAWCRIVTEKLNVDPMMTLAAWVKSKLS